MDDVTVPGQKGGQASAAPRWIPREAAAAARREPVATAMGEDTDPPATVAESGLVTLRVCIHRRGAGGQSEATASLPIARRAW